MKNGKGIEGEGTLPMVAWKRIANDFVIDMIDIEFKNINKLRGKSNNTKPMGKHEEALTSDSVSESEQESDSQSPSEDMDYDPGYDLNDYDGDFEPFQNSDDSQLDEDYSIDKDDFDYTQDQEDDFSSAQGTESEASSRGSGSEQEEDSQLAA
jgi:hypothetical protein